MSHKPLKVAAAKKSFPGVHIIETSCFDECFLCHVMTGGHYFLNKFYRYLEVWYNRDVTEFSVTIFLKEVHILYL